MKKIYLITGGSSDLAIHFLKNLESTTSVDDEIIAYCTYNKSATILENLKAELKGIKVECIRCDLSVEDEINYLIKAFDEKQIYPHYYIHCAANQFEYMRFKDFDWTKTKFELDVQVGAFAEICKWLMPKLCSNGFGRILTIGTAYTLGVPPKFMSDYIITKYALLGLVKSLAVEYSGKGVTINMLSPGMMETKFLNKLDKRTAEMTAKGSACKRNVKLDEVVDAMNYLLSDNAGYTNGINLNVSGGDYM